MEARIVPGAMAFDREGQLYFVDSINGQGARIARLESDGSIVTFAGTGEFGYSGDGGIAREATFAFSLRGVPWSSLVFDREGNLLILDHGNRRVRKIDQQGTVTTLLDSTAKDDHAVSIGDAGGLVGELALDLEGNLYFCTLTRVFRRRLDGVIERVAGSGEKSFGGDGGPALSAALNFPSGLAVGRDGQVYIGDLQNNRIRRVSRSSIISTVAGNGGTYTDIGPPCAAAEKRVVASDNPCLSALGDGDLAVQATIWSPERLLFDGEGDLLVAMHNPLHSLSWGGGLFSQLRRICKIDERLPTAVSSSSLSDTQLEKTFSFSVYPNPFNAATSIRFDIVIGSEVDLTIYNIGGQAVRRLIVGEHKAPDRYAVTWDGRDDKGNALASGSYLMVLENGRERHTQKMTLAR